MEPVSSLGEVKLQRIPAGPLRLKICFDPTVDQYLGYKLTKHEDNTHDKIEIYGIETG